MDNPPPRALRKFELNRLMTTWQLFRLLKRDITDSLQKYLCSFVKHYIKYQYLEQSFTVKGRSIFSWRLGCRRYEIQTLKYRYCKIMEELGFDNDHQWKTLAFAKTPPPLDKVHPENVKAAIEQSFLELRLRMRHFHGGAEQRDFEMLKGAEELLVLGTYIWQDRGWLVEKKHLVVKVFEHSGTRDARRAKLVQDATREGEDVDESAPPAYEEGSSPAYEEVGPAYVDGGDANPWIDEV